MYHCRGGPIAGALSYPHRTVIAALKIIPKPVQAHVRTTLDLFHAAGYTCFWVPRGAMIRASGACWQPVFGGQPEWSNLVCAHEPPVVGVLDTIAKEQYEKRRKQQP